MAETAVGAGPNWEEPWLRGRSLAHRDAGGGAVAYRRLPTNAGAGTIRSSQGIFQPRCNAHVWDRDRPSEGEGYVRADTIQEAVELIGHPEVNV